MALQRAGEPTEVRQALAEIIRGPAKASTMEFADILSGLALHYWRPDFSQHEAMRLNADYIEDLRGVTADELRDACRAWRRNPENRFYPTTGQMLALVKDKIIERRRQATGAEYLLTLLDDGEAPTDRGGEVGTLLQGLADKMKVR